MGSKQDFTLLSFFVRRKADAHAERTPCEVRKKYVK